ncbi:hypothetical protein LT85_3473 [Collimonas arenae]|uniref:Uncharacterized protein n=1 Tax=Collimonas arenae TaxID=279058 RepID=A0A0A1FDN3_9BURK|nr:hypothetical protein LT85_3473 [Collimonas arenae]
MDLTMTALQMDRHGAIRKINRKQESRATRKSSMPLFG